MATRIAFLLVLDFSFNRNLLEVRNRIFVELLKLLEKVDVEQLNIILVKDIQRLIPDFDGVAQMDAVEGFTCITPDDPESVLKVLNHIIVTVLRIGR